MTSQPSVTGHVFIAASLDGYIARRDGDIDWLSLYGGASEDHGYPAFMNSIDGIVMGRGTFEKVLTFGKWSYDKPVIVMSRSLKDLPTPLIGKATIAAQSPETVMENLTAQGMRRVYVDGGKVIQSFLRAKLIADMIVTHIPVLLGSGIPLFGEQDGDIGLRHVRTASFPSGLVQSKYEISNAR
ncbi:MAG: dihydrofolate reductase family protein [Rhizomicrobium sp.]